MFLDDVVRFVLVYVAFEILVDKILDGKILAKVLKKED